MAKRAKKPEVIANEPIVDWRDQALLLNWPVAELNRIEEMLRAGAAHATQDVVVLVHRYEIVLRSESTFEFSGIGCDGNVHVNVLKREHRWRWKLHVIPASITVPRSTDERRWCPNHAYDVSAGCPLCGEDPVIWREICVCRMARYGLHDRECTFFGQPMPKRVRLTKPQASEVKHAPAMKVLAKDDRQLPLL